MRGKITYKILNALEGIAISQIDFIHAFLKSGYGASSGKINYEFNKLQDKRIHKQIEKENSLKLSKYLSKLKSEGFILENSSKQIHLSDRGKKKLINFQQTISPEHYRNSNKIGEKVIVVSYDIPIAFNRERNILRDILHVLGFNLIHKSVWVGKVSLPERFVSDLSKLGIIDYVEILEVTKNGTLKSKN